MRKALTLPNQTPYNIRITYQGIWYVSIGICPQFMPGNNNIYSFIPVINAVKRKLEK